MNKLPIEKSKGPWKRGKKSNMGINANDISYLAEEAGDENEFIDSFGQAMRLKDDDSDLTPRDIKDLKKWYSTNK